MLAISIKNNWVRYTQGEISDHTIQLNKIDSFPLPQKLQSLDHRSSELGDQWEMLFKKIINSLDVPDREISISLGTSWIKTHIFDVDSRMSIETKKLFLDWILQQREGTQWNDMLAFYHILSYGDGNTEKIFSCTVYENFLSSVKFAIERVEAVPIWMEPSVSSISRVLIDIDDGKTTKAIVIEPAGLKFTAYFYKRGDLSAMATLGFRLGNLYAQGVKGDREIVTQSLQEIEEFWEGKNSDPDLHIFFMGEFTNSQIKRWKRNEIEDRFFSVVNPFLKMVSEKISFPDCQHGSWYVDSLGLMLRKLEYA